MFVVREVGRPYNVAVNGSTGVYRSFCDKTPHLGFPKCDTERGH